MAELTIVCVDFDGTIVQHDFPRIGEPLPHAFEVLKELKAAGFRLILWTCRENDGFLINRQFLKDAIEFCEKNGVVFDGHNETPETCEWRPNGGRKAYGHYYIDDRNLGGFPGWEAVRAMLLQGEEWSLRPKKRKKEDVQKLVAEYEGMLSKLAGQFRGDKDPEARAKITKEYAEVVKKLIRTNQWYDAPPPEDLLPYEHLPKSYYKYWNPD